MLTAALTPFEAGGSLDTPLASSSHERDASVALLARRRWHQPVISNDPSESSHELKKTNITATHRRGGGNRLEGTG
jgi:hypothetical protein